MTLSLSPMWVAAVALAVAGSSSATYFTLCGSSRSGGRLFRAYEAWLERRTSFVFFRYRAGEIIRAQVVGASTCLALLGTTRNIAFGALAALITAIPPAHLWRRHRARLTELERQLGAWLLMLANSLKATSSVGEAIASTVTLVSPPFSEELDLLVKEIRLGVPLDRALHAMSRRIESTTISGALATLLVARQTGGDLPVTLEKASSALRESARLEGVLRTKTAEGRGQVLVLASSPFLLCLIITWLDSSWFNPMLDHPYGRLILVACSLMWTVASLWAHYIVRVDL